MTRRIWCVLRKRLSKPAKKLWLRPQRLYIARSIHPRGTSGPWVPSMKKPTWISTVRNDSSSAAEHRKSRRELEQNNVALEYATLAVCIMLVGFEPHLDAELREMPHCIFGDNYLSEMITQYKTVATISWRSPSFPVNFVVPSENRCRWESLQAPMSQTPSLDLDRF